RSATPTHPPTSRLQFGHGHRSRVEPAKCQCAPPAIWCFNSATASLPWRTHGPPSICTHHSQLQFGHGIAAMENRGYPTSATLGKSLQFGHGIAAMENNISAIKGIAPSTVLQFGHGIAAMENS